MPPPDAPLPAPFPLREEDRASLRAALDAARAKGLAFARTPDLFEADVRRLGARHLAGLGLEPTSERVGAYVSRAALEDLVLACACEARDVGAWDAFDQLYRDRLVGFAVRRGISGADADGIVSDVFGDLFAPPPRGGARSLLGTFDGSGSLFGWLSIVVLRRIAGAARARKPQSLDALEDSATEPTSPRRGVAPPPAPPDVLAGSESATRFVAAFRRAFDGLTGQERLALAAKHRDGLTQKRAGELLGVGEARASRIVAAAVGKLAASLREAGFPSDDAADADVRRDLAAAIGRQLASSSPLAHPLDVGTAGRPPPVGGSGTSVPGPVRQR